MPHNKSLITGVYKHKTYVVSTNEILIDGYFGYFKYQPFYMDILITMNVFIAACR